MPRPPHPRSAGVEGRGPGMGSRPQRQARQGRLALHHRKRASETQKVVPRTMNDLGDYRFNRRNLSNGLDGYLIRRAVECTTITYDQLKAGVMLGGATRARRLPALVAHLLSWIRSNLNKYIGS